MMLKPVAKALLNSAVSAATARTMSLSSATLSTAANSARSLAPSTSSLLLLRGGAAAAAATTFDLERMRIRLEAFQNYNLVSSMLLSAALTLYNATPKQLDLSGSSTRDDKGGDDNDTAATTKSTPAAVSNKIIWTAENIAKMIFNITASISVVGSASSTIVFTLLGAYARTALSLDKEAACVAFLESTAATRQVTFQGFVVALQSFTISFCLSIFLNHSYLSRPFGVQQQEQQQRLPPLRWILSLSAALAFGWCWWQWRGIMSAASEMVFNPN